MARFPSIYSRAAIVACCLASWGCSIGKDVPAVEASVREFHGAINDAKVERIVAAAAPELQREPNFLRLLQTVQKKLGRVVSAKQIGWNDQATTGGHLVSLSYETKFERGAATENFAYRLDSGKPVLAGWHITSDALILN